jgi:hypothetical protein
MNSTQSMHAEEQPRRQVIYFTSSALGPVVMRSLKAVRNAAELISDSWMMLTSQGPRHY